MSLDDIRLGWFDFITIIMVLCGIVRGRKRGMSLEMLDLVQWITIILAAGLFYAVPGRMISGFTGFGLLSSYLLAYAGIALLIKALFVTLKRGMGEKMAGSDTFGRSEYYLGMAAGTIRFLCILLLSLSIINAKKISDGQIAAQKRTQQENFGDISFPTHGTLQRDIFERSFTGYLTREYLWPVMIEPTTSGSTSRGRHEGVARSRERTIREIIEPK
jgi:uncharacterized membrane protein required for colicin V production